jgi:hypothetical protein
MSVLGIELLLQLTGLLVYLGRVNKEFRSDHIRILTLGESTTDNAFVKNHTAWPEVLEKRLREAGHQVTVYNLGHSAITTNKILEDLNDQISYYRPHIFISMIGINDNDSWLRVSKGAFLGKIRLYKLLTYFIYYMKDEYFDRKIDYIYEKEKGNHIKVPDPYLPLVTLVSASEGFHKENLEQKIQKLNLPPEESAQLYTLLGFSVVPDVLHYTEIPSERMNLSLWLYKKSFKDDVFTDLAFENSLYLSAVLENCQDAFTLLKRYVIEKGGHLNRLELMSALECGGSEKIWEEILAFNSEFLKLQYIEKNVTEENYRQINKKILNSGAYHLAMQYPRRKERLSSFLPVDNLKTFAIYNVENFNQALKVKKWEELFTDRFSGNFGHTTLEGHKLIAKRTEKRLLDLIKKIDLN